MPDTRDGVFNRLQVDHLVRGSTRVSWSLFSQMADPGPYTFTLEYGPTGDPLADDWVAVGLPVVNGFFAIDDVRRDYGTVRTAHYRVRLVTALGTYVSRPAAVYGLLALHDWLLAREIVRKELLRHRLATVAGFLYKRRRGGAPQPAVQAADPHLAELDPLTGDLIRRDGPGAVSTVGTEFLAGYYAPVPFALDVANPTYFDGLDDNLGNHNPDAVAGAGRALLLPSLECRDVFAAAGSDLRYTIGKVAVKAAQRGVPLVGDVELSQLPFSDIIYTIAKPS